MDRRDRSKAKSKAIYFAKQLFCFTWCWWSWGWSVVSNSMCYTSKKAQTSLRELRTDQQEGLKASKGEVWWDTQPAWSPAPSCLETSMRITSIGPIECAGRAGTPTQGGESEGLQSPLRCWCQYLWLPSSRMCCYHFCKQGFCKLLQI